MKKQKRVAKEILYKGDLPREGAWGKGFGGAGGRITRARRWGGKARP